jgi:cytosine/adenosine deaminase-related metal-dependent hydrolase
MQEDRGAVHGSGSARQALSPCGPRKNAAFAERKATMRARWVFLVSGPPIRNGVVYVERGRIVAVEEAPSSRGAEDLGNVAILPGLVNAHTHLDLSDLAEPLGEPGIAFCDWIRRVIGYRRSRDDNAPEAAWQRGLAESFRFGATTLGDIVLWNAARARCAAWSRHSGCSPHESGDEAPYSKGPAVTPFVELIAPTPETVPAVVELAQDLLGRQLHGRPSTPESRGGSATATPTAYVGLSPHAPYSVHPDLLDRVVALSAQQRLPLAMHLAESREEIELLRTGGGPLRELLGELGAWCPTLISTPTRPLDYLHKTAVAHRTLAIHGNYLDDEEIALLAAQRQTTSVVYCPRTHAYFGHARYPLEKMLAAGVNVALGTDSRASSPDLSVLAEMREIARWHPTVARETILRMATLDGACALGCDDEVGTLEPGKSADLVAVALPDRDAADPHELLLDSDLPVVAVWRRGVKTACV